MYSLNNQCPSESLNRYIKQRLSLSRIKNERMIAKPFSDLNNDDVSQWTVAVARDVAKEIPWVKAPCRRFVYIEIPPSCCNLCLAARVAPFSTAYFPIPARCSGE